MFCVCVSVPSEVCAECQMCVVIVIIIVVVIVAIIGTRWRSWLRYCDTHAGRSQVRFPMGSFGFFHSLNPSGRAMALGLTVSNRNEYQRYLLGVKAVGA
jgi:hypothetical protein